MATISHNSEDKPAYLLRLVVDDLRHKLEQAAIDAIRPAVRDEITKAIEDMKPQIRTYVNELGYDLVVKLSIIDPNTGKDTSPTTTSKENP